MKFLLTFGLCALCLLGHLCAGTIHVHKDTQIPGNGTSWDAPLDSLQAALGVASTGDEIHVARGVYYPTDPPEPGGGEGATFLLEGGINLVGGFSPDGKERDPNLYKTVLSGDIYGDAGDTDPDGIPERFVISTMSPYTIRKSEHVITIANPKEPTKLDGLWIIDGHSHSGDNGGAGIWAQPGADLTLVECHFRHHAAELLSNSPGKGAAVRFEDTETGDSHTLTVTDCSFVDNGTQYRDRSGNRIGSIGSACYIKNGDAVITGTLFESNHSRFGGAIYSSGPFEASDKDAHCAITACRFKGNRARQNGGALYFKLSVTIKVSDCLFSGNHAGAAGTNSHGGAVSVASGHLRTARFTNNTFAWNTAGGSVLQQIASGGAVDFEGDPAGSFPASASFSNNIFHENYGANPPNGVINSSVENRSNRSISFYSNYDAVQEASSTIVDSDPERPNYFIEDFELTFTDPIVLELVKATIDDFHYFPDAGGDLRMPWGNPATDLSQFPLGVIGPVDADGRKRLVGLAPDLGCFEAPPAPGTLEILRVSNSPIALRITYVADRPVDVWGSTDLKSWSPVSNLQAIDRSPFSIAAANIPDSRFYIQLRYPDGE